MITFRHKGDFSMTEKFLNRMSLLSFAKKMDKYGKMGVQALQDATPIDTGITAASWYYEIVEEKGSCTIYFMNSNTAPTNPNINIALLIQYGHGTRNGGYVLGRDYINPALQPIFDQMAEEAWNEVKG